MSTPIVVKVDANGPTVSLKVSCPQFPELVAGVVVEYDANGDKVRVAGAIHRPTYVVPLGAPGTIDRHSFFVDGEVLAIPSGPPTPYQVVASITQGDTILHEEVPQHGGTGTIGADNVPFWYLFTIST